MTSFVLAGGRDAVSEFAKASADEALVVFTPSGRRGHFSLGTPVLQAARSLGVDLDSVCGGRGICGRCQVTVSVGDFAKHAIRSAEEHLSARAPQELDYDGTEPLQPGRRLGCAARIIGDLVIDVPAESQVHRQVVRKRAETHDIELDSAVRLYYTEVAEPDMHDPSGDLRRLLEALEFEWGLEQLHMDFQLLSGLQAALRQGEWTVTVAVYAGRDIIAVWPGLKERALGVAVDVGSTTIAAHLCDLSSGEVLVSAGCMNPQIRFGEDLMSRVSYIMMNPGGEQHLTEAVRTALNGLFEDVAREAEVDVADILDVVLVGNPVMHHLILGVNPVELGGAPFALALDTAVNVMARELQLHLARGSRVYTLPCVAGHVGADTAGVVLSEAPYTRDEMTLLVDVGTNAEIVLGNRERMMAASSPTGPAFEGAQISGGQRAAPGAIERVRIDPNTLAPRFKVIGCDLWSDDEDFQDAVAGSGITGICGSGIIEVIAEMFLCGIVSADGVVDGALAERSDRVVQDGRTYSYVLHDGESKVVISQNDVRAIQLAKAALYAGVRLLMDRMRVDSVDRIRLAGAFGSHIDVKYAMVLGLIPDCDLEHVTSAGNAAGTGARIALLDQRSRTEIEDVVRRIEKVETAVEARFQEHFVAAMAFPHKTDLFPNLGRAVTLPAPALAQSADAGRPRRRRARKRS